MRSIMLVAFATIFIASDLATAHDLYGHGIWGGAQDCGYGVKPAKTLFEKDFEVNLLQDQIKEARDALKNKTKKLAQIKSRIPRYKKNVEKYLKPYAAQQVITHVEERDKNYLSYVGGDASTNPSPACSDNNPYSVNSQFCIEDRTCVAGSDKSKKEKGCVDGKRDAWTNDFVKDESGTPTQAGFVNLKICSDREAIPGKEQKKCKEWLDKYMKGYNEQVTLETEIDEIKSNIEELGDQLADRKSDLKSDPDSLIEYDKDETTEATAECKECSWIEKHSEAIRLIAGIGLPILGVYQAKKSAQQISEQNARIGYPTSPYVASSVMAGMMMQGMYGGVLGGIGSGGVGCAGGYYGGAMGPYGMMGPGNLFGTGLYGGIGGAFGYPAYMYGGGPFGAGPYMPGMGPWGMAGPFGNGGFPGGYGGVIGGAFGLAGGGFPYAGGYPIAGYPVGTAFGGGAYGGGYPYGGGAIGGYPFGGAIGGVFGGAYGG
ncbi:MAG: hypothetical protein KDD40_08245, partial [Bdellovibrionales bacterium]|nr:hypothetical protein [Bdellovibrionales bacterium]